LRQPARPAQANGRVIIVEMKTIVLTSKAPRPIGPYSQATAFGGLIFVSGQGPVDPATNTVAASDIAGQTDRVIQNLAAILEAAGSSLDRALKVTVFLKDMNDFPKMNAVYARYFGDHPPARATVEAARLPLDTLVEIEAIAAAG